MSNEGRDEIRETLDDCLELMQHKLRRGKLTAGDLRALLDMLVGGGGVSATVADLAEFYGETETNVRSVIKRRVVGKPRRRVYYDFLEFWRVVPRMWHERRSRTGDCE